MISLRSELVQKLDLKLSPRMIQTLEILQLPLTDLQARIEKEVQENPVLEFNESQREDGPTPDITVPETPEVTISAEDQLISYDPDGPMIHDQDNALDFQRLEQIDRDWDGALNEESRVSRNRLEEEGDRSMDAMQNLISRSVSLQDHLLEQLGFMNVTQEEVDRVLYIIGFLDFGNEERPGTGYLTTPLETLVAESPEPVTMEEMQEALDILQKLEPAGIGARNLRECLLLQVNDETPLRETVKKLIQNHLEDIQFSRVSNIEKKMNLDLETILEAIDVIRHLDPKPASRFNNETTHYVVPDIIIERNDRGEYEIKLTDDWMPEVRISPRYMQMYKTKGGDSETRKFLREKLQAANWLRDAIEQRRNTLMKVTRSIIDHQRAFLDKGPEYIQPLKMQQIADQVGVHVTTVSRAVDNKWVQTPRGVFPLKRFFVGGKTNDQTGQDFAWEKVKQQLLSFIAEEDKNHPLSDDELQKKFQEAGYDVARRTVTKYRKLLNIASSRQRKLWGK